MANIKLDKINKIYDGGVHAVHDFSIDIKDGEFICFVGPSGCGKSTTLRMIAGLEEISSGDLLIDGKLVNNVPPKDRDIAMVFQSYALYPNMTVYDNMAFSLKIRRFTKEEIEEKVEIAKKDCELLGLSPEETKKRIDQVRHRNKLSKEEIDIRVKNAAKILGLTPYLERKPAALSGGQRQRVALGRAIVRNPKVFLMDEPLSNLDAKLRVTMRSEIIKIHKQVGATTIYVTHDQVEAMTMATRIVCMKDGYIQQIGKPEELYSHPANLFVAGFIGSPAMNFISGTVSKDGYFLVRGKEGIRFPLLTEQQEFLKEFVDKPVIMGIRPEHLVYSANGDFGDYKNETFTTTSDVVELLGDTINVHCLLSGNKIIYKGSSKNMIHEKTSLTLAIRIDEARFFSEGTGKAITKENPHYEKPKTLISTEAKNYLLGSLDNHAFFTIAGDSYHKFQLNKSQFKLLEQYVGKKLAVSFSPLKAESSQTVINNKTNIAFDAEYKTTFGDGMVECLCDGQRIYIRPGKSFDSRIKTVHVNVPLESLSFYNLFTLKEITKENNSYSENTLDTDQVDIIKKESWSNKLVFSFNKLLNKVKDLFHGNEKK